MDREASGRSRAASTGRRERTHRCGDVAAGQEQDWDGTHSPRSSHLCLKAFKSEGRTFQKIGLCHSSVFKGNRNGEKGVYPKELCLLWKQRPSWEWGVGEGRISITPGWGSGNQRKCAADPLVQRLGEDGRPLFSH